MATMSIMGLYNYDSTIFDGMTVPEHVDKDTVRDTILLECAELEVLYPSAPAMKAAIEIWSRKELSIWAELQKTKEYTYNPIYNVEAHEVETEERDLASNRTGDSSATNAKTAFNTSTLQTTDGGESDYHDNGTETGTITRTRERGGNIGVTMTQQLIEAQRQVVTFDMIDYILQSFKRRFCLMIY